MDTIKCMNTFVAVASQKSFTGGAKRLSISTKLASKYVQQLEEKLGAQLFNRTTRSVTLTDIGQAYFDRCVPLLDQFDELEGLVQERQSELAGPIRITAPTAFGSKELVEAILPFQLKHPKVLIDLHLSDQRVAIVEGGFDLAIRFGQLNDSSLIARKLMDMRIVVVASPEYIKRHGRPQHPKALSTHNCLLQMASVDPEHWKFRIDGNIETYRVNGTFHGNSPRAISHMALGGLGIGMCPLYVVEDYINEGKLELLFEDKEASEFPLNAIYPPSRHLTARIRALIDHLAEIYSTQRL
ncbi:LysR family transcriptional regulator [Alteromonadaceae bacterium M269]|nr:LysR family transcriptional regulator [Alteromonadaceae bacterium M269]